jgi:hypothetical protein
MDLTIDFFNSDYTFDSICYGLRSPENWRRIKLLGHKNIRTEQIYQESVPDSDHNLMRWQIWSEMQRVHSRRTGLSAVDTADYNKKRSLLLAKSQKPAGAGL